MTKKQKEFITNKLIPFILREQGRGFDMAVWKYRWDDYELEGCNTDSREKPSCGTVCCIGGSIQYLLHNRNSIGFRRAGERIGLDESQSERLFSEEIKWPPPYQQKYLAAKTPWQQAKVAVSLLKEVVRTDGEVLR